MQHVHGGPTDDAIFETDEDFAISQQEHDSVRPRGHAQEDIMDESDDTRRVHTIEITLHADSEFFNLLVKELSSIDDLQARQKESLTVQAKDLGRDISMVTEPSSSRSRGDLYAWREIFALYQDASVFFATTERHRGPRGAEEARQRVQWFSNQLVSRQMVSFYYDRLMT